MKPRARIWLALMLPPPAWFGFQQGLSAVLHARCDLTSVGLVWGVASLAACVIAAWLSRPFARGGEDRLAILWLARLALILAAVFALAIAFQMLAILVVPPCVG